MPDVVRREYSAWSWEVAWRSVPEVVTWRLTRDGGEARYLKVADTSWSPTLPEEEARLKWAFPHLRVPEVLASGGDGHVAWMITRALPGRNATHAELRANPRRLVRHLGEGLRRFHEAPVGACPFDFRLDAALRTVRERLETGRIDALRHFHPEHRHLTPGDAVSALERNRPDSEDLVVCHGDYCLPNVLIEGDSLVGFVDLGELGVADRWWDLAVATWSATWNLGPGHENDLLRAYGIDPDPERTAYYRLLYDLAS